MTATEALRKWRGDRTAVIAAAILGMPLDEYQSFEAGRRRLPDWLLTRIGVVRARANAGA
jgi:hypothetical protein